MESLNVNILVLTLTKKKNMTRLVLETGAAKLFFKR